MISINDEMSIALLCGFIVPHFIWSARYFKILKKLDKKIFIMYIYTSSLSIFLSLNQFLINLIKLDIWVFLLFQISLLPFLRYYDNDLQKVYKANK